MKIIEKLKKLNKKKKILLITFSVLLTIVLTIGIYAGVTIYTATHALDNEGATNIDIDQLVDEGIRLKGIYNFILGGTDVGGTRTDALILVNFNTEKEKITMMSIPRDTYIDTPKSSKKINAAYAYGKGDGLKEAIKKTFGIDVDGYVVVSTSAFKEFVDLIGGVEVDVKYDMYYEDPVQDLYIHIKKGKQVLKGNDAEGFVRYRYGYATGDLGRIEAQKVFISAMIKQVTKPQNIIKMPKIVETVFKNIKTDITSSDMIKFATEALKVKPENIIMINAPGKPQMKNKVSYFSLYKDDTLKIINEHFNPYSKEITEKDVKIIELVSKSGEKATKTETISDIGSDSLPKVTSKSSGKKDKTVIEPEPDEGKPIDAVDIPEETEKPKEKTDNSKTDKDKSETDKTDNTKTENNSETKPEEPSTPVTEEKTETPNEPEKKEDEKSSKKLAIINYCVDRADINGIVSKLSGMGYVVQLNPITISFDKSRIIVYSKDVNIGAVNGLIPGITAETEYKENSNIALEIFVGTDIKN